MFVTAEDFDVLPYVLLDLNETVEEGELTTFERFVAAEEEAVLGKLLGRYFYDKLAAGIEALPNAWAIATAYAIGDKVTYSSKVWTSLTAANTGNAPEEGADWTEDATQKRWLDIRDGIEYTASNDKKYKWGGMNAALKPYIYSAWVRADLSRVSATGLVHRPKTENSDRVLPDSGITKGFNEYSDKVGGVDYVEYDSLYGLLYNNAATYDVDTVDAGYTTFIEYLDDRFKFPGYMNIFNI